MSNDNTRSGDKPGYPLCAYCGSHNVGRDAWAVWDDQTQTWVLGPLFDQGFCFDCDGEARLEWHDGKSDKTSQIRDLNDALRRNGGETGRVLCTAGIDAQDDAFKKQAWEAVASFEAFDRDNDPYGEHDFGSMEVDGKKLYFKIDYYGLDLASASDDPADRKRTQRMLTIMLAEEY